MAADLLIFGLELFAATTAALLLIIALRWPCREVFGARAAYALWLILPAVMIAVAIPRAAAPEPPVAAVATVEPVLSSRDTPPASVERPAFGGDPKGWTIGLERPDFVPNPKDWALPLLLLWALGAAGYASVLAIGQRRFVRALGVLRLERRADGPVFHAQAKAVGPALVGALWPRVVLPSDFAERFSVEEQSLILAHERIHLRGGDAQINLAVAAFQVLFWFNPLAHLGARLIRADQEQACDETVASRFPQARRLYAEAMLKTQLSGAPVPLGCHWLSGDKVELRRRINRLKRTPAIARRAFGLVLATTLAAGGGAAAWATQPAQPPVQDGRASPTQASSNTAIIRAIENGRISEAVDLIDAGADVNAGSEDGASLLMLAVRQGELSLTRRLLDRGAEPNLTIPGEGTALIIAADNGDLAAARLLLEYGADPDLSSSGDGNPLIAASGSGQIDVVDLLLAAGARIDAIVVHDETALITAARRGQLPVVRRLVEAGADVNQVVMAPRDGLPPEPRSPLGMARRSGRADIIDYLRAHGARA